MNRFGTYENRGDTVTVNESEMTLIIRAYAFAAWKHRGQKRKGGRGEPYINHCIDVTERLWVTGGVREINIIAAAILHDTVEDTDATSEELAREFGDTIARIVMEVTDDTSKPSTERKRLQVEHAHELSTEARHLKIADKLSNVHDIIASPPRGWSVKRCTQYVQWAEEVIGVIRGTNKALEAAFDETAVLAREKLRDGGVCDDAV